MHEMKVYTKEVQFWIFCRKRVGQSVHLTMAISHPSMGHSWILGIDLKKSFVQFYTNPGHFFTVGITGQLQTHDVSRIHPLDIIMFVLGRFMNSSIEPIRISAVVI